MHKLFLALGTSLVLTACAGDPLRDVPRLADVEVAEADGQAGVMAPDGETAADTLPQAATSESAAPRRGLLGMLKRQADAAKSRTPDVTDAAEAALDDTSTDAAPEPEQVVMVAPKPTPRKSGLARLFGASGGSSGGGRGGPKPGAPDYEQVPLGTRLPYGEIARVCGVSNSELGQATQSWPEGGNSYTLYDSAPGNTGAHIFYMTGFGDDCARTFTAALVMFGSPETWEQIHYGPAGASLPVSATDSAYEDVKSGFCRVKRGEPCGKRLPALEKHTVFVSVYERFEDNTRWKNILLHDGEVVAIDVKG
ncbi:hypothetical protein GGQ68_003342 [Sagittula marina]|uniref:Uncharacterized protein n=1 Tax=Sagittula marina TaxID=943940 RepID=A0A7W6DVQ5_9RHOB|nr:hypothetical protein [Sagittula marina]MBB3986998.1 hypothetical protein [Sagittula marina]